MPVKKPEIFNVDWRRYVRMLVPFELRAKKMLALLYAIFGEVASLHSRFIAFRTNTQYSLGINYQVCNLERLLNDKYDNELRRIYIENQPLKFLPIVLYTKAEARPVKFYQKSEEIPVKFYMRNETPAGYLSFIIYVPIDVTFIKSELLGLVKGYALQTKTFEVYYYG